MHLRFQAPENKYFQGDFLADVFDDLIYRFVF